MLRFRTTGLICQVIDSKDEERSKPLPQGLMVKIPAGDARAVQVVAAIQTGEVAELERLLAEDSDLAQARIIDQHGVGRTLLHIVADWPGHFPNGPRTVAILIAAGAEVDAGVLASPNGFAETPLHWAASSNDVAVLDALLDGGADIEAPGAIFTGGTPMSDAVVFAQWRAARRLLERGATTTVWQAAGLGLLEGVRLHFSGESKPSEDQVTNCLWHACRGGHREVAEFLLDQGADLNWIGYEKKTPLDVAGESGAADLIEWLRSRGAKLRKEL